MTCVSLYVYVCPANADTLAKLQQVFEGRHPSPSDGDTLCWTVASTKVQFTRKSRHKARWLGVVLFTLTQEGFFLEFKLDAKLHPNSQWFPLA